MLRKSLVGLLLASVGGVIAFAVWLWWNLFRPLPSDASLSSRFLAHRSDFDSLATMALADTQLVGAGHDWMLMRFTVFVHDNARFDRMLPEGEVRATGRTEYRRLIDRAGVPSVSRGRDAVWFMAMSHHGRAMKGIVYSERALTPLRPSLDGLERENSASAMAGYVPLAPKWFLFLEPTD
jgi:hypothetical protein